MAAPLEVRFTAGVAGFWSIERIDAVRGETLPAAERLQMVEGGGDAVDDSSVWTLRGVTSNERYVTREEHAALAAAQESLGRPAATRAALIPIKKSGDWWELAQDERRAIFEETSHHVRIGLEYLPAVARRLHHSRELGGPFDFLTWFEYSPMDAAAFEELVARLRSTDEWRYVEREVDVRLTR